MPHKSCSAQIDYTLNPTEDIYDDVRKIIDYLNFRLFDDALPNCLITLRPSNKAIACFSKGRFQRGDGKSSDEIALNPHYFETVPTVKILSVLTKEMVHCWQHYFGKPGRGGYHNCQWADKMKEIGLHPSHNGQPGGRETGDRMSFWIMPGGLFENSANELINAGYRLSWQHSCNDDDLAQKTLPYKKSGKRIKYQCPLCGLNAWAKHGAKLICEDDNVSMADIR